MIFSSPVKAFINDKSTSDEQINALYDVFVKQSTTSFGTNPIPWYIFDDPCKSLRTDTLACKKAQMLKFYDQDLEWNKTKDGGGQKVENFKNAVKATIKSPAWLAEVQRKKSGLDASPNLSIYNTYKPKPIVK